MRKVTIILPDSVTMPDEDVWNGLSAHFQIPNGSITVERYIPGDAPDADALAQQFLASSPTDEPTIEKEIELDKNELDATPTPPTQAEGGIGEQSTL